MHGPFRQSSGQEPLGNFEQAARRHTSEDNSLFSLLFPESVMVSYQPFA
jgi:hypothetical protein